MVILASGTVLLALIGIYGVVWFSVSRRTKEMGIRIALGATRHGVVYHLLRSNMRPVYVGLGAGLVLAAIGSLAMKRISSDGAPVGCAQPNDVCCGVAALANCGPWGDAGSRNTGSTGKSGASAARGINQRHWPIADNRTINVSSRDSPQSLEFWEDGHPPGQKRIFGGLLPGKPVILSGLSLAGFNGSHGPHA